MSEEFSQLIIIASRDKEQVAMMQFRSGFNNIYLNWTFVNCLSSKGQNDFAKWIFFIEAISQGRAVAIENTFRPIYKTAEIQQEACLYFVFINRSFGCQSACCLKNQAERTEKDTEGFFDPDSMLLIKSSISSFY